MIIMHLSLDNYYAFRDFEIDMSYPKKSIRSSIENEFLQGFPNFRYKKVNILFGSNASGKTTLGKAMMNILNFIARKDTAGLEKAILDQSRTASFSIDFIAHEPELCRVMLDIIPDGDGRKRYDFSYDREPIRSRDSYQSCAARIDAREPVLSDYNTVLDSIGSLGWMFSYPESRLPSLNGIGKDTQLKAMKAVLMTLDPSIKNVRLLENVKDISFIIEKDGREILLQNGNLTDPERFSSGTKDGVYIAGFLAGLMENRFGLYYCDEQFSFIHSAIEKRILGIMISKLGVNEQLFFTTHNETIMEENLPKHSFVFLVRQDDCAINALYANDFVPKPLDNLRKAVENDIIQVIPDDTPLDNLEE